MRRLVMMGCYMAVLSMATACTDGDDAGDRQGPPGMGDDAEPVVSVETVVVEQGEFQVTGDYAGEIRSEEMVELSADVAGRVIEMHVNVGDQVEEGDLIAKIDDRNLRQSVRELEASVRVSEANLEEAKVELENLESELRRKRPLFEREMIPEREIEELERALRSAEQRIAVAQATIEQRNAQLASVGEDLGRTQVRAPFDGVIGARQVERGSHVSPGQPLVTLVDDRELYLTVRVPERQAPRVGTQTPVTIRIGATGSVAMGGEIHRIAPVLDSSTRTLRVDIRPEGSSEFQVRPGMYARVSLELGRADDAVTVDNQAVQRSADGEHYLWRVRDDRVEKQEVEFGLRGRLRSEIVRGLEAGDRVVLRGHEALEEGSKVRDVGRQAEEQARDDGEES